MSVGLPFLSSLSTFEAVKNVKSDELVTVEGEELAALKEILLATARDIAACCEENGIEEYALCGGTLLGAVREGGFIAWDDDIDFVMSRRAVNSFIPAFVNQYGDRYWVHTPGHTHDYGIQTVRVRVKGTVVRGLEDSRCDECGATVDIFVVENVPDNALVRNVHGFATLALGFLLSCRRFYRDREVYASAFRDDPKALGAVRKKIAVGRAIAALPLDRLCRWTDRCNRLSHNASSRLVTIPSGRKHYFGEMLRRSDYFPTSTVTFEGSTWRAPGDSEAYLVRLYGEDYMTPPPEGKREHHAVLELDLGGWQVSDEGTGA